MNIRDFRIAVVSAQQIIVLTEGTWSGSGSNNNWSTASNWTANRVPINTNNLIFAGSTRLTPTNDLSSFIANNISFAAGAGAFSISGNAFTQLNNSSITNNSSNAQTISNNIALSSGTAGGIIDCNLAAITLSGAISGANGLIKNGLKALTLSSQSSTYSGSTSITAGTLIASKGIATGSFTAVPLTADFSSTPSIGQTYRFFPGSTVQRYYSSTRSNGVVFAYLSDNKVKSTSHGLPNGTAIYFSSITSVTGISINTRYYTVNATTNDFQLSATVGGAVLTLTTSASTARAVMSLSTSIGSVGFVDSTNRVTLNAHGLTNGSAIYFSSIASTTGISINTVYYVIASTTNDFQLAATVGGGVIDLVADGTGVLCKNPMVSLTNAGGNIGSYSNNTSTLSVIGQLGTTADTPSPLGGQTGYSVDINAAGDVIVFGARFTGNGKVYVYAFNGSNWIQRGATFSGTAGEQLGNDVSINSDGTVIAMSSANSENVKVYTWSGSAWVQRGATFTAGSGESALGYSISLNAAGDRLAIGAYLASSGGLAKVYSWSGSAWVQLGSTFTGSTVTPINTGVGYKVVLNTVGDRILITSLNGDSTSKGMGRVYSYSGSSWSQLGNDILGTVNNEQLGLSASMNAAGDVVALGSSANNKAKVYSLISSTWTQLGSDIIDANTTYFARSISLNAAGDRIAIGEPYFANALSSLGRVRIYDYSNSAWSQFGSDILGNAAFDSNGTTVALNSAGDRIIVGTPGTVSYQNYGYVRTFQI